MAKYLVIDRCPVPAKLHPVLAEIKERSGVVYNSIYRGADARELLRKLGKKDQAQLYADAQAGRGNPANPPNRSTHELRSDGVAFPGPVGRPLRWWQCGIDCSNPGAFIAAARVMGWIATVTYPNNPREQHHVNLRKEPRFPFLHRWAVRPLKSGDTGARVRWLIRTLRVVQNGKGETYLSQTAKTNGYFNAHVEEAVKAYQKDHHMKPDGVVGQRTRVQLGSSLRYWQKRSK